MKLNTRRFLLSLVVMVAALSAAAQQQKPAEAVKHVDAAGAAKLLKADPQVVVLDIRTPDEFSGGHLKGAKNIDFYGDDFAQQLAKLDKGKTYLVHCASGGRSGKSLELFKKLEFRSVVHLDGGYKAWTKAGEPVEK